MDGNVDELAVDSRRGSKGSGRSCVSFEPVRDERRPSQEREVCFGSTSTTRAILFTYLSLDGPSTRWADPGRLISLCFSGRQFANDLVSCVDLIGGSTETTMMILVIAALVVIQTASEVILL